MNAVCRHRRAIILLLIILIGGTSSNAGERFDISGYFKSFSVAYGLPDFAVAGQVPDSIVALYNDLPWLGSVSNRLRVQTQFRAASWLRLSAAYDISPRVQDQAIMASAALLDFGIISGPYRFDDLDSRLYPRPGKPMTNFGIYQNLDRLQASIQTAWADITIGRQAIAWGTARVVNPTDFIAPFAYGELDTEDRFGVDAIRIRRPLGLLGEIDLGYVGGHNWDWDHSAAFLRGGFNHSGADFSGVVAAFRGNLMVGGDITKSIGGAGTWLEVSQTWDEAFDTDDTTGRDFFRLTIGADYCFSGRLYGFAEYHYNGAGFKKSGDYTDAIHSAAYTEGAVYLLGRHYLIGGASYQVTPLITATAEVVGNVSDLSAYLSPGIDYNIAEDIYLSAGAFIGLGESPSLEAGILDMTRVREIIRSEFGSYPDFCYLSFGTYF
ncbi:MAG: hypothetical protein ABIE70_00740 [bacterium]